MSDSKPSLDEIQTLVDEAVIEIDVPPSLRQLAKRNLSLMANQGGLEAVQNKIHSARDRKERIAKWLDARRMLQKSFETTHPYEDIEDVENALWVEIQEIAREKFAVSSWARHFLDAASKVDRNYFFSDVTAAKDACMSIFQATTADDFEIEPPVIRGSVLSEAGNMFFACAALTNSQQVMEESLTIYGNAVRELSQVSDPSIGRIVDVVQINRGSALSFFVSIVGKKIVRYKEDALAVRDHIITSDPIFPDNYKDYDIDISDICKNLDWIDEFSNEIPRSTLNSNLKKPPIEPVVMRNALLLSTSK